MSWDIEWILEKDYKNGKTPKKSPHGLSPYVVILQYDKNSNLIKEWSGISIASKKTGISTGAIQECLSKRNRTGGGFIWEYKLNKNKEKCHFQSNM